MPLFRLYDHPHVNMAVRASNGWREVAHVYVEVPGMPRDAVLVTLGDRDENLARVEEAYRALGWKLLGSELVQTG